MESSKKVLGIVSFAAALLMATTSLGQTDLAVYQDVYPTQSLVDGVLDTALSIGDSVIGLLSDGDGTIDFNDAGIYSGAVSNNARNGEGVYIWPDGTIYDGTWKADATSGEGTMSFPDGTVYSGTFSKNKFYDGTITVPQSSGAILTRTVTKGQLKQNATLDLADGTHVQGNLQGQKLQFTGNVSISYRNGDSYSGQLKNGYKSGQGTYTWKNGAHYIGKWKEDKMDGAGTYYYSKDEKKNYVKGTFIANMLEGDATYVSSDGIKYSTTWLHNVCRKISYKKK